MIIGLQEAGITFRKFGTGLVEMHLFKAGMTGPQANIATF